SQKPRVHAQPPKSKIQNSKPKTQNSKLKSKISWVFRQSACKNSTNVLLGSASILGYDSTRTTTNTPTNHQVPTTSLRTSTTKHEVLTCQNLPENAKKCRSCPKNGCKCYPARPLGA